ncbi:hypothetical protein [Bdellovibrio bacteriovorus]
MNAQPKKTRSHFKKDGDEKTNGMTTPVTPAPAPNLASVFK